MLGAESSISLEIDNSHPSCGNGALSAALESEDPFAALSLGSMRHAPFCLPSLLARLSDHLCGTVSFVISGKLLSNLPDDHIGTFFPC